VVDAGHQVRRFASDERRDIAVRTVREASGRPQRHSILRRHYDRFERLDIQGDEPIRRQG
jgi:hypothetical protein